MKSDMAIHGTKKELLKYVKAQFLLENRNISTPSNLVSDLHIYFKCGKKTTKIGLIGREPTKR